MNHQDFQDLLCEDAQDLSPDEILSMRAHMSVCEPCRALAHSYQDMTLVMGNAVMLVPEPGFAHRWGEHLSKRRESTYRRQILKAFVFIGLIITVLLSLIIVGVWPLLRSPGFLVWAWLYRLLAIYSTMDLVRVFFVSVLKSSLSTIPLIWWVLSLGLISEFAVLWFVSYRVLTNPRRVLE